VQRKWFSDCRCSEDDEEKNDDNNTTKNMITIHRIGEKIILRYGGVELTMVRSVVQVRSRLGGFCDCGVDSRSGIGGEDDDDDGGEAAAAISRRAVIGVRGGGCNRGDNKNRATQDRRTLGTLTASLLLHLVYVVVAVVVLFAVGRRKNGR
jgi:hypothetical protein